MFELISIAWAGLVIGFPLTYVTWNALRRRQYGLLLATITGLLMILLFSGRTLPAIWLLLLVLMSVCLAIFVFYTCLAMRLILFPKRSQVHCARACAQYAEKSLFPQRTVEAVGDRRDEIVDR